MTATKIASLTAAVALAIGGVCGVATWQDAPRCTGMVVADTAPSGGAAPTATSSPGDVTWGG